MIEVQHVSKRYGRVTAVDDVSFKVERGEILGFLGPNGAGKTTTMRILTGYMPASEGKAMVAGFDVFEHPLDAKRRTGYLPESPPLYPDMTVREYLDFVARIKGVPPGERKSRVTSVMKETHVSDMADRHCSKLSKGYRQRVGLAQALIHNPEVLILDEPTAGLDPKQIIETRQLIRGLAGSHTIVLSTHILPEVAQTCQRVVIINKGRVVAVDTPENLTARLTGAETMYIQIDAAGAEPGSALACDPRRVARGRVGGRRLRSRDRARDRRAPGAREDGRQQRVGIAGASADADEPRGGLPPGDDRRKCARLCRSGSPSSRRFRWTCRSISRRRRVTSVRNILAIAGKELRGYFASPMGYILVGLFALLFGAFFRVYLTGFADQSQRMAMGGGGNINVNEYLIRGVLHNVAIIILFVMPLVTMRTYAEEKRSGTMELLLTSPITDVQIIVGKFLGAMGLFGAMLLVTAIDIAILFRLGNPELKPVLAGYLGLLLLGGCFLSVGLFLSSLTKNQIVAGVMTFAVFLMLWIINWFADSVGPTGRVIVGFLSITEHLDDFTKGIIDTKHIVYYLSFITFGLFLTAKSVDSERWRG